MSLLIPMLILTWIFSFSIVNATTCTNKTNWEEQRNEHRKLIEFLEEKVKGLENGSQTLKFINWEDDVLRLVCPETEIGDRVKRWTHRYFLEENVGSKDWFLKDSNESEHTSWQLIVRPHRPFNYSTVYSCENNMGCWHHFYVVTRPSPKTTSHIQFHTGSNGNFSCWGRNKTVGGKYSINTPLQNITWRYPHTGLVKPDNVEILLTSRELNGVYVPWDSQIIITNASQELNAGIHECIVVDKFNVSSTPEGLKSVYLRSGKRYFGVANVHVRPRWYVFIPIGITVLLCCILPLLVRFCPTSANEADLEEEDEKVQENQGIYTIKEETNIDCTSRSPSPTLKRD